MKMVITHSVVIAGFNYVVRPVGANYLMQPQTRDFTSLNGDKTADFIALSVNQLLFTKATYAIVEGTPNLTVTVVRGGNATGVGPITVQYTTVDGTATAGSDYSAVTGTLNFPEGTFSQTSTIPIVDDQNREGTEQFSIKLSEPTGEVDLASPTVAVINITDNEPVLVTEANSDRAIALNNVSLVASSFTLITEPNYSSDKRTRLSILWRTFSSDRCFRRSSSRQSTRNRTNLYCRSKELLLPAEFRQRN